MMKTDNKNLCKFGVKNGKAYEGKIGFDKDDNTCVKWYVVRGYKGMQIIHNFCNEGKKEIYGQEIVSI